MPKRHVAYTDALARLLFSKPLADFTPAERAELDLLRALDTDAADEEHYEELAAATMEAGEGDTIH